MRKGDAHRSQGSGMFPPKASIMSLLKDLSLAYERNKFKCHDFILKMQSQMHKSKGDHERSKSRFSNVIGSSSQHQVTLKRHGTKAHEMTIREWHSKHQQNDEYSFHMRPKAK